jgi:hypothetical protein
VSAGRTERIKLVATTFNAVGLGFLGFAFVRPVTEGDALGWRTLLFCLVAFAFHLAAHYVLKRLDDGGSA